MCGNRKMPSDSLQAQVHFQREQDGGQRKSSVRETKAVMSSSRQLVEDRGSYSKSWESEAWFKVPEVTCTTLD